MFISFYYFFTFKVSAGRLYLTVLSKSGTFVQQPGVFNFIFRDLSMFSNFQFSKQSINFLKFSHDKQDSRRFFKMVNKFLAKSLKCIYLIGQKSVGLKLIVGKMFIESKTFTFISSSNPKKFRHLCPT